jgi:hypothetical protein
LAVGVAALLLLVVTAFAWPAVNSGPHDVPLAVVAPPPVAEQLGGQLAQGVGEDAFEIRLAADRDAAEQAILDRDVYGAIVLGPGGGAMLTASAASPAVAQMLEQVAANVPAEAGGPLTVTDLRPLPEDDPRGVGLGSTVLPVTIAGLLAGAASALGVRGRARQVTSVLTLAVVGGLVLAAVSHLWLGAVEGSFWAAAGVLALGVLAIGATALGVVRLLGRAGLGVTALVMILLGGPLSGVQTAPEMVPAGWGTLGQLLPPGATGTALRAVSWFDGVGSGTAFLVLAGWVFVGLLLLLPGPRRWTTF